MGKTHGDKKWTAIYAVTTSRLAKQSVEERMFVKVEVAMRTMTVPTIRRTISAYGQALLPCATMCTLYHQRPPCLRRPRLLIAHYSHRWMVFDKYSASWRAYVAGQARSAGAAGSTPLNWLHDQLEGYAGAHVDPRRYGLQNLYDRMPEPSIWQNPVYVEEYPEDGALVPRTPSEPTTAATEVDIVEIHEEEGRGVAEGASLKMYTEWNSIRNDERAKLEVESEEAWEFRVGESLRLEWGSSQRRDPECQRILRDLKNLKPKSGRSQNDVLASSEREVYRTSDDGVLERKIVSAHLGQPEWVPVVPEGYASGHITWKKFVFLQCHLGIFGGHRN